MSEPEASDSTDVREWFERLNDTFGAAVRSEEASLGPLLEFYAVPITLTTDDEHMVLSDSASVMGYLSGVVDSMRHADYDRTVIHRLDIRLLNARSAIIDVDVSRLSTSGDEIAQFGAIEIASRTEDSWRISAVIVPPHRS